MIDDPDTVLGEHGSAAVAAGKKGHHIGDYIPPEELERFMAKCNDAMAQKAAKASAERAKIQADNVGHRLLSKMGWKEGTLFSPESRSTAICFTRMSCLGRSTLGPPNALGRDVVLPHGAWCPTCEAPDSGLTLSYPLTQSGSACALDWL